MINTTRKWATLAGVLLMATALGCASTATQEGTGEYVDDTVITGKVKTAIFNEPTLKSAEIKSRRSGRGSAERVRELGDGRDHRGSRGTQRRGRQVGQERHASEVGRSWP
jgi:hypothetical protein